MKLYYKFVIRPWFRLQVRLIKRRGGLRNYFRLNRIFGEIASDKYVAMSREKYSKDNSYPRNIKH
jgi:hypothetical protein